MYQRSYFYRHFGTKDAFATVTILNGVVKIILFYVSKVPITNPQC